VSRARPGVHAENGVQVIVKAHRQGLWRRAGRHSVCKCRERHGNHERDCKQRGSKPGDFHYQMRLSNNVVSGANIASEKYDTVARGFLHDGEGGIRFPLGPTTHFSIQLTAAVRASRGSRRHEFSKCAVRAARSSAHVSKSLPFHGWLERQ
jgi:hypothetical protein